jgi:hypothetical protein
MKLLLRCFSLLLFVATALAASAASTALVTPSTTTYSASGSAITVTVNLNYDGTPSALDFSLTTPPASGAWKVPSVVGPNIPQTIPDPEDLGAGGLGFVFTDIPVHAASFSFTLSYPAGMTGEKVIPYTVNFTDESGKVMTVKAAIRLSPAA